MWTRPPSHQGALGLRLGGFDPLPVGAQLDTTTIRLAEVFPLSSPKEERAGERRPLLLKAPHPNPLPTRSSRGEGENFWWLCQDAPCWPRTSRFSFTFIGILAIGISA